MNYINIDDLIDENFEDIQGWRTKLEFSRRFYYTFGTFSEEEKELLDEECMNIMFNNSIRQNELLYQKNRFNNGWEHRNYKEVSIMFVVNKLFERLMLIFVNREFGLNLEVNCNSYDHTNSIYSRDSDFVELDKEIYYDLEGRTFERNTKTVIQFLEHKVKKNFKQYIDRNNQLRVIQYFIQSNSQLQISIIDINDLYKNNLFYKSNEHTSQNENVYRINKEIKLETYFIDSENKIVNINVKGNDTMTRSEFNRLDYSDIRNFIIENVKIEDVLEHFGYHIENVNHFNCIFHEDNDPSAAISRNKYVCWAGCLNDFCGTSYLNVIELYSKLTNKDLKNEIWDIMYDLYHLSNIDVSNINIKKKKNNSQYTYDENSYKKKQNYLKTKDRIHNHLSEEETPSEKKYCSEYLEKRGITEEEKLMEILNLNDCKIAQKYFADENYFYFDYGSKTSNKETIVYRKIDKYVNPQKYEKNIESYKEQGKNYIEKGVVGFNDYHVLKTNNKVYYRDEDGNRILKEVVIFEGFMDCFSFIDLSKNIEKYTLVVLNSISNIDKLLKDIEDAQNNEENANDDLFGRVYKVYTDNDEPGRRSFEKIKEKIFEIDEKIIVEDFDYEKYMNEQVKDLNEYCIELKKIIKEMENENE